LVKPEAREFCTVVQPEGEKGILYGGTARGGKGDSVSWCSQRGKRGFCSVVQPEGEKGILYGGAARGGKGDSVQSCIQKKRGILYPTVVQPQWRG
jgi:hypothetical protein